MNDNTKNYQAEFVLGGSSDEFYSDQKDSEENSSLKSAPPTATDNCPSPPEKTVIIRRAETGCLPCRQHRIYCDEGNPTCQNCIKSKRQCYRTYIGREGDSGSSRASVQPYFAFPPAAGRQPQVGKKRPTDDGSGAEDNDRSDKRPCNITPQRERPTVRCPWKDQNPDDPEFDKCGRYTNWRCLREHILDRKHKARERCPTCGKIFFDGDKWAEHTSERVCQASVQPLKTPFWVDKSQDAKIRELTTKGRKNAQPIEEMYRKVCDIVFGDEIAPGRIASGHPIWDIPRPTDDLDIDDRPQEPWNVLTPIEGYSQPVVFKTPMGTLPGQSFGPVPHYHQGYKASPSQSLLYAHHNLGNRDSNDSRSETVNRSRDGPQPVIPALHSPIDYYNLRTGTFTSHTSRLAAHDHGELSLIQNASPRPESNAGIALPPNRDHLGAEAWPPASSQQSSAPSSLPRGIISRTPSLNTLLSRDDTVLPQMSPTSPYREVPSNTNHSIDPNSHTGMPTGLLGHKDDEIYQLSAEVREKQNGALFPEGTIADSGYVSACVSRPINDSNSAEELRKNGTLRQAETQSQLTVDQQTEYTSSVLSHGSDYVSDLCNEIHMNLKHELQEHTHTRARTELPRCLPDLIKAFSIRIGLGTSNPSSAQIMHFLHTHHKKIVTELQILCRDRGDSPELDLDLDHRNTGDEEMTVMDRMALWTRKQNEQPAPDSEQDSLFAGVSDIEEEDIVGNARMATHRDFVLSSNSYQWFIESLTKQLSLDWGSDYLTEASLCRPIYRSIISRIPPGTVSKHRMPEIHHARFEIKMYAEFLDDLAKGPIKDLMTLTSSADNVIQALSVQDYMGQTWPSEGLRWAKIIQEACDGGNLAVSADDLDDGTRITAQLARLEHPEPPKLLVTVSGSRYSIAECGEQLAWLCAAFQRPIGKRGINTCTCNIEVPQETEGAIPYSLHYSMQYRNPMSVGKTQKLFNAPIIEGFPTKKRPPLFHGLELGLAPMLECIGASWPPVFDNGRTFLKGSYHTMELAKHTQNVWLWHIVHPGSTACPFPGCASQNEHDMPYFDNVLQTEFVAHRSRHIVANMECFWIHVVGPSFSTDKTLALGHAYVQTEFSSVEARDIFDPALSPFEDKSNAMDSSGDTLDSDMLSISSEDSNCPGNLDPGDPLKLIIDQISHRILVEYEVSKGFESRPQQAHVGNCETGENLGSSANSADNARSCATSQTQRNEVPQKSKRRIEDDEDWDDGFRKPPRPKKRVAMSPETPRTRALACPFWKLEPQAHGKCFPRKLSRISDVKQHLRRDHKQPAPDYCQRCWTAFENEADKIAHLSNDNDRICRYNPAARPPGIDNAMDVALNKKSKRDQSIEDRWFTIWDIVFPGQPRPSSPYIGDSLTEDATQLQEIIVNRWPSILSSILDGIGGSGASIDIQRVEREHLIRATLVRLSDEFSVVQARNRAARSASIHQSPGAQISLSSNRADSAIEVDSYGTNSHSSADSSGEAPRTMLGATTMPQLGTRIAARSQNSAMHNRRERFLLPQSQNRSDLIHDHQQQMQIPPPTTSSGTMLPDPVNAQMTDFYGTGHSLENDLTTDDLFPQLSGDSAFQSLLESGDLDTTASLQNMGALTDSDWLTFES